MGFNPAELRDPSGKWSKTGILSRLASEAKSQTEESRRPLTLEETHDKIKSIGTDKGIYISGHNVHHTKSGQYRVRLAGENEGRGRATSRTQIYNDPREAAVAVFRGEHHKEGESPIPLPGGGEPGPRAPEPRTPPAPRTPSPRAPRTPRVPPAPAPRTPAPRAPEPAGRSKPANITYKSGLTGIEQKRLAAAKINESKAITESNDGKMDEVPIVITTSPHGSRAYNRPMGSIGMSKSSKYQRELHLNPVIFTPEGDAILKRNNGWWVPIDDKYSLGNKTTTHEFGHQVHYKLSQAGIVHYTADPTEPAEHEFWNGLADSMGLPRPQVAESYYGTQSVMKVDNWMRYMKAGIASRVSTYGASNKHELLAELWTEYNLNSNPRPPAKYYGDFVKGHKMQGNIS